MKVRQEDREEPSFQEEEPSEESADEEPDGEPDEHFDVNAVLGKSQGCNGLWVGSSGPPMSTQPFMAPIDFISMDFMPQTSKDNSDSRFCYSHMSQVT